MQRAGDFGTGYSRYVLAVLLFGYALNSFDRSILSLLLEPIRAEFGVSDTQLGLLTGLAFAAFFSTLAIPIAALADRWHRRNVLALAVLMWTLMTALCGLAGSFAALLLARMGVAVGEAGGNPPSHSLLADYFPPERRATALGIYALGAPAGSMLAGLFGGWGSENLGWRGTLVMAGAPGLLLVPLLFFPGAEPGRPASPAAAAPPAAPPLPAALWFLWSQLSYRHLCLGSALHSLSMYAASSFIPAYLARSHGWEPGSAGKLVAMIGLAGLLGAFLGGYVTDRLRKLTGDVRWQLWLPGLATLACAPVQVLCYLGSGVPMVIAFMFSSLLSMIFFGPAFATAQSLAQPRMRAVAAAVLMFSTAMIGMGFGPLLVGIASDQLAPALQQHSLRFGLLIVPLVNLWAAVHFFRATRHLGTDLARATDAAATP